MLIPNAFKKFFGNPAHVLASLGFPFGLCIFVLAANDILRLFYLAGWVYSEVPHAELVALLLIFGIFFPIFLISWWYLNILDARERKEMRKGWEQLEREYSKTLEKMEKTGKGRLRPSY